MNSKKSKHSDEFYQNLLSTYKQQRNELKKKWDRVLPFNELISDRWEKASFLNAKNGTSIYDNSYIFGKVRIGKNTWIGPFTILDGSGGLLSIGSNCSVSTGVQIYTHNTVKWAVSGGKSDYEKKPVKIGDNCYVGPNSIIGMGVTIGKGSVIGTSSFVNSKIPPHSIAFGSPAKVVGKVIIKGKTVNFEYFNK
ncbi:Carbonic anhydrase-acetyltransferase protein [Marine Group I thaumarchaeote SCGC AAA799-P11]|uniref:Carbonic anhydrase-acetyltransferase protein n=1 Tax=Marine Group I thaumarchaeote SCGC AAA799-P11 TaxID=1502295 RepID=A0A087RZ92_9ARCH|nr:Carbonic anhydrase-acetyltransferase protein [Marine Group I thaumarchaeote SCGC AAA799-P11]